MGSVVISVDVDPGLRSGDGASGERYRETLATWRRASYSFDRHEVPATWLVAGHLFAPVRRGGSSGERGGPTRYVDPGEQADSLERSAEEVVSSDGRWDDGHAGDGQGASQGSSEDRDAAPCVRSDRPSDRSRFADDPAAGRTESARSAPDLIASICRSRVGHEIGCQPFSRLDLDDASQADAIAAVRTCIDEAAELGVRTDQLRAFAFPGGRVGHRDVLAAYGLECYREPNPRSDGPLTSLRDLLELVGRRVVRAGPPLVEPATDEYGLVSTPTSMALFPLGGRARAAARAGRRDQVADLAKRGVDRAAGSDGLFHLSVRLRDVRSGADFERLEAVLAHVAASRREQALTVETMGQVARRVAPETAPPSLETP